MAPRADAVGGRSWVSDRAAAWEADRSMVVVIRSKNYEHGEVRRVDGSGFPNIERRMERCAVWEWVNPPSEAPRRKQK